MVNTRTKSGQTSSLVSFHFEKPNTMKEIAVGQPE